MKISLSLFNILAVILALLAMFAILAPRPAQALDDIQVPKSFYDADDHAAKLIGNLTVTQLIARVQTQTVTNSQAGVDLPGLFNVLTATGATNGIALAAPGTGNLYRTAAIIVAPDSTNFLYLADSGTAALSGAWTGSGSDVLLLFAASTGAWLQVSTSNN